MLVSTWQHRISFAIDLAANFGCNQLRIMRDINSKLLRSANGPPSEALCTNTGRFQVDYRHRQRLACLRKSAATRAIRTQFESKRLWFLGRDDDFCFSRENGNSMDFARACYRPKQQSSLRSIFQSFVGLWVKRLQTCIGLWVWSKSCPVLSSKLSEIRASAQIPIKQHSHFRCRRAWKRSLACFWVDCNQGCSHTNGQLCFKAMLKAALTGRPSISDVRIFKIFSNLLLKIIIYCVTDQWPLWPTIHNSISRICPNFQFLTSHVWGRWPARCVLSKECAHPYLNLQDLS